MHNDAKRRAAAGRQARERGPPHGGHVCHAAWRLPAAWHRRGIWRGTLSSRANQRPDFVTNM